MLKGTGLIHIYYGDGKGKTTTGMGLITRAAGFGYKVLLYQFMKDNTTSERNVLEQINNIVILNGLKEEKFSFQMTETEKEERRNFYEKQLKSIIKKVAEEKIDVLFLDEVIYTISAGLLKEQQVLDFLKTKPENLEVILTGNTPSQELIEASDYVSEIRKIKHPYNRGQAARDGIER